VRGKKNRVGAPFRAAEFTLNYTKGIINIGDEIYNLAKSLQVVKHPINPDTGRENPQMWQMGNNDSVRGEEKFKEWFLSMPTLWDEAMSLCSSIGDDDEVIASRNKELGYIDAELGVPELDA